MRCSGAIVGSGILAGILLVVLMSAGAFAQGQTDPNTFIKDSTMDNDPTTPSGRVIAPIYQKIIWASIAVFVLVAVLLTYILIRFRHRKGVDREVPQIHGNSKLEIAWTIGPALVMFWLLVISYNGLLAIDRPEAKPEVFIEVEASRFLWSWTYSDGTEVSGSPPILRLQEDVWVQFNVTSNDVIHALAIPGLDVMIDANPGHVNSVLMKAERTGTYLVQCRQFCGTGHGEMLAGVEIFPAGSQDRPFGALPRAAPQPSGNDTNETNETVEADVTLDVAAFDFGFNPAPIGDVEPGSLVQITLTNDGGAPHNLYVGEYALGKGTPFCADPSDETTCATTETIDNGETSSIVFTVPDEPQAFNVWCNVPGHAGLGMLTYLSVGGEVPTGGAAPEPRLPGPGVGLIVIAVLALAVALRRRA